LFYLTSCFQYFQRTFVLFSYSLFTPVLLAVKAVAKINTFCFYLQEKLKVFLIFFARILFVYNPRISNCFRRFSGCKDKYFYFNFANLF